MIRSAREAASGGVKFTITGLYVALLGGCAYDGLTGDVSGTASLGFADHTAAVSSIPVDAGETARVQVHNTTAYPGELLVTLPDRGKARRSGLRGRFGDDYATGRMRSPNRPATFTAAFIPAGSQSELVWWFIRTKDLQDACNTLDHPDLGLKGQLGFDDETEADRTLVAAPVRRVAKAEVVVQQKPAAAKELPAPTNHHPPSIRIHPPVDIELPTPMLFAP